MQPITTTDLKLPLIHRGKVREMYDYGTDQILMVATDRISAFDVVFDEGIPFKGAVLSTLSKFWFEKTKHILPNHVITTDLPPNLPYYLKGRAMIVKKAKPLKIEIIVRGYLTGSGFKDYQRTGSVCGIKLPVAPKCGVYHPKLE